MDFARQDGEVKRLLVVMLGTAILLVTGAAFAQDTKGPAPAGTAAAQPARGTGATEQTDEQMKKMDEQMKRMRALHDRMIGAASPAERQRLMEEQHKAIREGISTISQMMAGMSGTDALAEKAGTLDPNGPIQVMQKGIEMMALMTQMMMDQLGLRAQPGGRVSVPGKWREPRILLVHKLASPAAICSSN